jgi:putative ABC transport system ATP-binding protein
VNGEHRVSNHEVTATAHFVIRCSVFDIPRSNPGADAILKAQMPDMGNILEGANLDKSFGKGAARVHVLRGLDIAVRRGEFLAVMGPSGCGKSTLLHVLGLMTKPVEGRVAVDGRQFVFALPGPGVDYDTAIGPSDSAMTRVRRTKIGFVFQRFNLLSVLSGTDNVAISLHVRGVRDDGRAAELFRTMGVEHVAHRKPGQMSVGEQQRVAIVRALAHRPAVLLADEPTGNLDSENSAALLDLFRRLNRDEGQTIVMITHSAEAASYADRVARMKDGKISA